MIIGIGGYATAGKDAVAELMEKEGLYRTFFAKPVHEALMTLNPYVTSIPVPGVVGFARYADIVKKFGYDGAKEFPEVRRLIQALGTEVGQVKWGERFWLLQTENEIDKNADEFGKDSVVTGVRYKNQLRWVESDGVSVWVERPGVGPVNSHSSDNTLQKGDFKYVLNNDGTLEDLEEKVYNLLEDIYVYWNTDHGRS